MIDFSNVASMYGNAYSASANQTASKLQDKLHNSDYSAATEDELMDACRQFEAYFIEQVYKSMMKTIPSSEGTSNYTSTMMDYYKDMMVQSLAEETTSQNSLGLAQMLYEQMKRNYGFSDIPVSAEAQAASEEPAV